MKRKWLTIGSAFVCTLATTILFQNATTGGPCGPAPSPSAAAVCLCPTGYTPTYGFSGNGCGYTCIAPALAANAHVSPCPSGNPNSLGVCVDNHSACSELPAVSPGLVNLPFFVRPLTGDRTLYSPDDGLVQQNGFSYMPPSPPAGQSLGGSATGVGGPKPNSCFTPDLFCSFNYVYYTFLPETTDGNLFTSNWFGSYIQYDFQNLTVSGYITHATLGSLYIFYGGSPKNGFYFVMNNDTYYTSSALYPYIYDFAQKTFLYYYVGTKNPRHFYNFDKKVSQSF